MNGLTKLFVAWQHPQTFRFYVVGRLSRAQDGYEFCYIGGARDAEAAGFEPFLAFPELHRVYRSQELFTFFANRLLSSSRDDSREAVCDLGLDPRHADPFDVLARSGGRRATDAIEVFACPQRNPATGKYCSFFLVHGLRHMPAWSRQRVLDLTGGTRLFIAHDFQNPVDPNALLLRGPDYTPVGFLPRYLLPDTWSLVNHCGDITVNVERLNPPPAPLQQRLLCRLDACWPEGFQPCESEQFVPLVERVEPVATMPAPLP